MRLLDAYNLLVEDGIADNHRYFAEVYKQFQFRDEDTLKDYIEFILHEPVHWMRGFPTKLTSKTSFSKPKTAIIKLLKKSAVMEDLGIELATQAHSVIWDTYKSSHEELLKERRGATDSESDSGAVRGAVDVDVDVVGDADDAHDGGDVVCGGGVGDSAVDGSVVEMDVESYEILPVPTMPRMKVIHIKDGSSATSCTPAIPTPSKHTDNDTDNDAESERVVLLKQVLYHLLETLPDGVSDAFRLLVERV
jgi:hypothetical protein